MITRLEVIGEKEVLARLTALQTATSGMFLSRAVMAGALLVMTDAKRRAPVLTGNLRRSIHVEQGAVTLTRAEAKVGTDVEYAPYVEFGTSRMRAQPYLRPAAETMAPAVQATIEALVASAVETF